MRFWSGSGTATPMTRLVCVPVPVAQLIEKPKEPIDSRLFELSSNVHVKEVCSSLAWMIATP
jgi:hypothetical protein